MNVDEHAGAPAAIKQRDHTASRRLQAACTGSHVCIHRWSRNPPHKPRIPRCRWRAPPYPSVTRSTEHRPQPPTRGKRHVLRTAHRPPGATPRTAPWRPSTRTPSKPASGWKSTSGSTACCAASDNVSPTFRFPDLISACVSLVFAQDDAAARIFDFLGSAAGAALARRRRGGASRCGASSTTCCWPCSARRPTATRNPKFQLDQLTTACVALCRQLERADTLVLQQARLNMADRSTRWRLPAR